MKKIILTVALLYNSCILSNQTVDQFIKHPAVRHATTSFLGYFASDLSKKIIPNDLMRLIVGFVILGGIELYRTTLENGSSSTSGSSNKPSKIDLPAAEHAKLYVMDFLGYACTLSHPFFAKNILSINTKTANALEKGVHFLKDNNVVGAAGVASTAGGLGYFINKLD